MAIDLIRRRQLKTIYVLRERLTVPWIILDHFCFNLFTKHCPVFFACFPRKKVLEDRVAKGCKGKIAAIHEILTEKMVLMAKKNTAQRFGGSFFLREGRGGMGYFL